MTDTQNGSMDLPTRLLIQAAILKELKAAVDTTRLDAIDALEPGDKKAPRYTGAKIGTVSLSDPDPEPVIKHRAEFDAWVRERRPDLVQQDTEQLDAGRAEEIFDVLRRHAPHLVVPAGSDVVPEWAAAQALRDAVADGELPDGVELVEKAPVLSVRPSKDAAVIARSVLAGADLLALEGGEPA